VAAFFGHRHARGVHRLNGPKRVALDAGDLHQAADRIAGHAEVVFHADFGRVLDGFIRPIQRGHQATGGHGARYPDFALASNFGA